MTGNNTKQIEYSIGEARLLKVIIEEKALVRLLKLIASHEGDQLYTRQILKMLGEWGYGHKLLEKAEANKLITRKLVKNKVYNSLTKDGKKIVEMSNQIGI